MEFEIKLRRGPKGGEYWDAVLPGGELIALSAKPGDDRVWEAAEEGETGRRGGTGRLDDLLEYYSSRLAEDPGARVRWDALRALKARKERP